MRKGCRKHAARQSLRKVTAANIILLKKKVRMIQNRPAMTTAAHHVLPVLLLLRLLFQKICVWNCLITKPIRILSFNIQTLIFQIV